MLDWLTLPGWLDLVDIGLVSAFGWLAIGYARRAHARPALAGLAVLAVVYGLARAFDLRLSATLLQGFFAVVVLVLVVVFQEDLRRVFEQLGTWRRGREASATAEDDALADLLVRAVTRLAAARTGALIVLAGREPLERHVDGGVALDGRPSVPLLLSIFDASSPGHDGAVLVRDGRLERFALHLPLSTRHELLGPGGTRHAAALGLAEVCDAVCIVVSEERGTVSIAQGGTLRALARPDDLRPALSEIAAPEPRVPGRRRRVALDALAATAAAFVLWMVFVPGSDESEAVVSAGVEISNLPPELALDKVEPPQVDVTLRGTRRDLLLAERNAVVVRVNAELARLGRRTFTISEADVTKPDVLDVVSVDPRRVRVSLQEVATAPPAGGP